MFQALDPDLGTEYKSKFVIQCIITKFQHYHTPYSFNIYVIRLKLKRLLFPFPYPILAY